MNHFVKNIVLLTFIFLLADCTEEIGNLKDGNKQVLISPDYADIVIPPNIAPLNFNINEPGEKFRVEISSEKGEKIVIVQNSPKIDIPLDPWHSLLSQNKGKNLYIEIYIKNGEWLKYKTIVDSIAEEDIENHLVYRVINSQYVFSRKMELYQRNLENFTQDLIFENSSTKFGCFNCHAFSNNNPEKMSLHLRQEKAGTMILDGNKLVKLATKTPFTMSDFGYPSWNPNGELIAYSVNIFNEYFLNDRKNLYEVTDQASDIIVYNVKTNTVTTTPKICTHNRENFPTWSPDGKWLYFISAPETKGDFQSRFYTQYSLLKIQYDQDSNTWGDVDTVLSASQIGKSITFPRISPDGKYLMFCMIDHGYFSINHMASDLYLMDLTTLKYYRLDINTDFNESYHSWSANGRWFVFSSKRLNNMFSQPYFSYFDKKGKAHKPFILPQKDPLFYGTFLSNFNIPELVNGKVNLNPLMIRNLVYQEGTKVQFDPAVETDALSGATWIEKHPQ